MIDLTRDQLYDWTWSLPVLSFPFPISIVPPGPEALIRFRAGHRKEISVYLDAYDNLGAMGQPYWELYPNEDGDAERFYLAETDALISKISALLESTDAQQES